MKPILLVSGNYQAGLFWINQNFPNCKYDRIQRRFIDENNQLYYFLVISHVSDIHMIGGMEIQKYQFIDGSQNIPELDYVIAHLNCRVRE